MSSVSTPTGCATNWLPAKVDLSASTGAGGRLAVMPRPRFAPREGLVDVHGSRGRRQGAMARRETKTRLDISSRRPTPPAPLAGTTKLRCRLMPRQRRDAGANTPGDGAWRTADFVGPRLVCVEHTAARTFASPARRTSVATAHIGQTFPLAIGLARDARPASQCASPSSRGLMKYPG